MLGLDRNAEPAADRPCVFVLVRQADIVNVSESVKPGVVLSIAEIVVDKDAGDPAPAE